MTDGTGGAVCGGGDGDDCVEMAACADTVHVRDSKDVRPSRLALSPGAWSSFVSYACGS